MRKRTVGSGLAGGTLVVRVWWGNSQSTTPRATFTPGVIPPASAGLSNPVVSAATGAAAWHAARQDGVGVGWASVADMVDVWWWCLRCCCRRRS